MKARENKPAVAMAYAAASGACPMILKWDPGPVLTWTCGCGLRPIATDPVELERLKREHADFHLGQDEWEV